MKKYLSTKIRLLAILLLFSSTLVSIGTQPAKVAAQNFGEVCHGVAYTGDNCDKPNDTKAQTSLNKLITRALEIFSLIVGIVAVVMIMFGGFRYITAGGDSGKISSAQQTIIYALVGLVVAAMARSIAWYIAMRIRG